MFSCCFSRKKFLNFFTLLALMLLPAFLTAAPSRAESLMAKLKSSDRNYVFVVMHRGDWRSAPENSTDAIRGSIAKGADVVELDVAKTKDGHYVLLHDGTLNRVSNGKGLVDKFTLKEIKKFRLKSSDGKKLTDYEILTLDEAFKLTKGKILVNLDKFPRDPRGISEFVKKCGMENEVVLKGPFTPAQLKKALGEELWDEYVAGKFCFMPIIYINKKGAMKIYNQWKSSPLRPVAYELCFAKESNVKVLEELEKVTNNGGSRIWINTLWDSLCAGHTDERGFKGDPDGSWGWCLGRNATIIQTDRPVELMKYLESKDRRK
jgi:glycerophosphoryl diester phosphodiesterase